MKSATASTAIAAICTLLAACDGNAPTVALTNLPAPVVDACSVALASTPGDDEATQRITDYQRRAAGDVTPLDYLEKLGWTYVQAARTSHDPGFYTLAASTADCLYDRQPGSTAALLLRGHVMHAMHRFAEAEGVARRLVAERGSWFDHALLGDALMEQGDLDDAIAAYTEMVALKPGSPAFARIANVRWLRGDLPGAIEAMDLAARSSGSREATAWSWSRLADYQLQAGDLELALRYADAALKLLPGYAPALLSRGRILLAQGAASEAVVALESAAGRSPLPEYRWALIEALRVDGRDERAAAVELELLATGARDDARTFALYLASHGLQPEVALQQARAELLVRRDVITLDTLAWAHAASGALDRAAELSASALAEGTRDARLRFHAGVIAKALGRHDEARRLLGEALASEQTLMPSERARLRHEFAVL